jgi:hypothetical protein
VSDMKRACVNEHCDVGVKCFGCMKRVPNSQGPPNVCLNYSVAFCKIIPIGY